MSQAPLSTETVTPNQRIWLLQKAYLACPKIYGVWVRCSGEESLLDLYESQEAAEFVRAHYNKNNRGGYLGKATVRGHHISTMAIAQERFK